MPTARMRMFLDNAPASEEQLAVFGAIRIDQSIGMATEAEIDVPAGTDESGTWQYFEDAFAQPFARVRVEVAVAGGTFVPLIDGPVVAQRFQLEAAPESSRITLVVHDDSVLLNRDEAVVVFEDQSPSQIAEQIFSDAGFDPRVDTVAAAGSALKRYAVQRGTPMQMLRRLARDNGMFVYVEPGDSAGRSIGVFQRPLAQDDGLPDLVLRGEERNIGTFTAEFDALRPQAPQAASVLANDRSVVTSVSPSAPGTPLGPEAAHAVLTPAVTLLSRTREEQADIDAATAGAAELSSWAWTAQGEVHADGYAGVLRPYRKIAVRGVGGHLSGDYLISRVAHEIRNAGYKQQFSLTRNARGAGAAGASGLPGGVL